MEATKKPVILFLMMQNPDIDHLVPIAVLLAETKKYTIKILTYQNHVNFQEDERIKYLKENYGVKVKAISDYYPISSKIPWLLYRWRSYWGIKCKNTKPLMIFGINIKSVIFPKFHIFRISRYFVDNILRLWLGGKKWGVDILHSEMPSAVVIDHAFVTYWISSFIKQLKSAEVPIISIPHSCYPFVDASYGTRGEVMKYEDFPWDYVIVENISRQKMLKNLGVLPKHMLSLGCVRFTNWWIDRSPDEQQKFIKDKRDKRPVVLYLGMGINVTTVDGMKQLHTVMLKHTNEIHFIVKAHARRGNTRLFKEFSDNGIEVIGDEVKTPDLINASDFVIVTASSVINDAIVKNKPVIFARFTMDGDTLFGNYNVTRIANTPERLNDYLVEIKENKWAKNTIAIDRKERYLYDCVYGGFTEDGLLLGYQKLLAKVLK